MEKIEIMQEKLANNKTDSFFYDGTIAKLGDYSLIACGDIRIYSDNGMYDVKPRDSFDIPLETDEDLRKVEERGGTWDMNNWLEVVNHKTGDYVIGDVAYYYDEGIELLKTYYEEKTLD